MSRLGHALLAGVISGNPTMTSDEDEEENLNAGWGAATVENSPLYGHPLVDTSCRAAEHTSDSPGVDRASPHQRIGSAPGLASR
jgi:hypothetical protein